MGFSVAEQSIVNIESLKRDFRIMQDKDIKLEIPALEVEKEITASTFEKLRSDIFELSKQFPHKRIAVTYKTNEEDIRLVIHPVTGAA